MLAEEFLENNYPYCPKVFLNQVYRMNNVRRIIEEMGPDVVCLQEVMYSVWPMFQEELGKLGWQGLFKKRTGEKPDGIALFFKIERFGCVPFLNSTEI